MLSYSESLTLIENRLSKLSLNASPSELYDPIRYILKLGGKRIRPCLAMMTHSLYSNDYTDIINPALGIEVFHNFTLLHDDIMDKAVKRRNHDTVHIKWNDNIAILSGDAMMILAYRLISKTSQKTLPKIFDLFSDTALKVCEGQQYDMNFEKQSFASVKEYLDMIELKTAVLIAASLAIGAITGNATQEEVDNLYRFGLNIGIGFQLQDDYLDVYADTHKFGKTIGSDILSNKKTFLMISALNSKKSQLVDELKRWIAEKNFNPEEKIRSVKDIYDQLNIGEVTDHTVKKFFSDGLNYFDQVKIPEENKKELRELIGKIIARES